jgi:dihydrofolate synthase/folylpolyglutamate synthase
MGLMQVQKNTRFKGRFQILQHNPTVLIDAAHNEAGVKVLFDEINKLSI